MIQYRTEPAVDKLAGWLSITWQRRSTGDRRTSECTGLEEEEAGERITVKREGVQRRGFHLISPELIAFSPVIDSLSTAARR